MTDKKMEKGSRNHSKHERGKIQMNGLLLYKEASRCIREVESEVDADAAVRNAITAMGS